MIARIYIFLLLLIILPDIYVHFQYLCRRRWYTMPRRLLWWLPSLMMTAYTLILASVRSFVPENAAWVNVYLFFLGITVIPKVLFAVSSLAGLAVRRMFRCGFNWGNVVGAVLSAAAVFILVYGSTAGFNKLRVRQVEFRSEDLPAAFDGYRIVQFSDAHVGSYTGSGRDILAKAIDSINAQRPDAVVFTGDLQNMQPSEIVPVRRMLARLRAADGVFSVLGNHDYAEYIKAAPAIRRRNETAIKRIERGMGWQLLLNSHRVVRRGADSIVIAGMENDGRPPFPQKGDVRRTLRGVTGSAFTVMLQHDPTSWRRHILPQSNVQLTLSGHTHAGQFKLFGWSPVSLVYDEWEGMYTAGGRALYVSTGLGGFVPFRFGVPGEIVVITLRRK